MTLFSSTFAQFQPDSVQYPFASNYFETAHGRMHYLDEGSGPVILMVHGTPTWSFLYRHYVRELSKTYRCIVPDHLGFGLSDHPTNFAGTPEAHSNNLVALINHLQLDSFHLIVHDFGGPFGLGAALQMPDKVKKIVLHNTWLWETADDPEAQKADRIISTKLGRWLYLKANFSPKVLLKKGFVDRKKLDKATHRHYTKVFPNSDSRHLVYQMGKNLVGASKWYGQQWKKLTLLEQKDWLIVWGEHDPFLGAAHLKRWTQRLPDAPVHSVPSGHFVQEEAWELSISQITTFFQ